jgi:protein gp37
MVEQTKIEWADHTFNPWEGCQKVGPGCDNCYAEARNARFGGGAPPNWGPGAARRRTSPANWRKPLKWNEDAAGFAEKHGRRQRVFCASLADVFDNAIDPAWRSDLFALVDQTPNLDWLLLTKRVGNVQGLLEEIGRPELPLGVWLGATIVNQQEANRDIPKLLLIPAAKRFLSMEPLLGPVQLRAIGTLRFPGAEVLNALTGTLEGMFGDYCSRRLPALDWIIVGGESGPDARPMHPDWVAKIQSDCELYRVPFLFKQWGEHRADKIGPEDARSISYPPGHVIYKRVGKKAAGRKLFGVEHNGFPA